MRGRALTLGILLCVGAVPARAQEALFLAPESAAVRLGEAVRLSALPGADAEAAPLAWPGARIGHFFARTASTQENRDELAPAEGTGTAASWPAEHPGTLLLGIDLEPAVVTVSAGDFAAFLGRTLGEARRAALGEIPAGGEVTILRTESAKALVRVEAPGKEPASVATSKTGQAVEIRPLMDLTAVPPGSDLALRLYSRLPGTAGGVVIATNITTGESIRAVADASSIAHLDIAHAGRWRVEFHAVAPNDAGSAEARWLVHTATLTFDVAEEGAE